MPKLIRLYIVNCALGFAIAAAFVAGLLALDVAHLRHLVASSPQGWLAVVLLVLSHGVVFAGVQFAIAVMRLAEPDEKPRGGRKLRIGPLVRLDVRSGGNRSDRGDVNFPRA